MTAIFMCYFLKSYSTHVLPWLYPAGEQSFYIGSHYTSMHTVGQEIPISLLESKSAKMFRCYWVAKHYFVLKIDFINWEGGCMNTFTLTLVQNQLICIWMNLEDRYTVRCPHEEEVSKYKFYSFKQF